MVRTTARTDKHHREPMWWAADQIYAALYRCADCRKERDRKDGLGRIMGAAIQGAEDVWYWFERGNQKRFGDERFYRFNSGILPLIDGGPPVVMECGLPDHAPRSRLPEWIVSRACKALADGYVNVHL